MKTEKIPNIHPGEILLEEFMKPMELNQHRVAKDINVPRAKINEIIHCKRGITVDTALRLSKYFGTSVQYWLNLQIHFDLENEKDKLLNRIEKEVHALESVRQKAA